MSAIAEKTDPKLWERVKDRITRSAKGGKPGQWSARKAQLATQAYKAEGGGYSGRKAADNHLVGWTEEEWGTKSGRKSAETGERYLPKAAREALTPAEYRRTTQKKRRDTVKGKQTSRQPAEIARKTARYRDHAGHSRRGGPTKADLMAEARVRNIPGRSTMSKAELERAVA